MRKPHCRLAVFGLLSAALPTVPVALEPPQAASAERPASRYHLYVTTESDDHVHHVLFEAERRELSLVDRIEVGYMATEIEGPHGLAVDPDGQHWYVTLAHGKPYGMLYKYATADNRLVGQCELGLFPATMQISPATGLLYAVNFDLHGDMSPSSVSVVDPEEMVEVARTVTGPMPHGSRVSADGLRHYSCAMMSGDLYEIDATTFGISRILHLTEEGAGSPREVPPQPSESAGKDPRPAPMPEMDMHGEGTPGSTEAASSGAASGEVAPMRMAPSTKPTWVYPHPTLPRLYVALNGAAQVVEVDTETWRIVRRFPTAKGPYNVEVTKDGTKFVVTYKSAQSIGIFDVNSGRELARLPSSRPITHGVVLSNDSRFAFVTSEGIGAQQGTLDVYDLQGLTLIDTLELGLQAGGLYFWKRE